MSEPLQRPPREIPWAALTACLLVVAAAGLAIAGVYVLAGPGWAFIAGAAACALVAWLILRGMA
jgi:membrane protein YdbS with pleckstrin-like domain